MNIDGDILIENLKVQRNAALDALAMADTQRRMLEAENAALKADLAKPQPEAYCATFDMAPPPDGTVNLGAGGA